MYKFEDCPIIKASRLQATVIIYKLDILFEDAALGLPAHRPTLGRSSAHPSRGYRGPCSRDTCMAAYAILALEALVRPAHRPYTS